MTSFVLIRHGQASFGSDDYDRLSTLGEAQSDALGRHFESSRARFTALHSGAMKRQKSTAAIASARLLGDAPPLVVDPAFDEYATHAVFAHYLPPILGADRELREILAADRLAAGRNRALSRRVFFPVLAKWLGDAEGAPAGVESFPAFRRRVVEGLGRLVANGTRDDHVAVFTSSGVISVAMMEALSLPDTAFVEISWRICNASLSRFVHEHGRLHVQSFNTTMHLETDGRTDAITYL